MNFMIIFSENKIERNLIVQSRKAFSKSENIRSVALYGFFTRRATEIIQF